MMANLISILTFLPLHLYNIEDYLAITATSRAAREILCESTSSHVLLLLCYESRRTFFRPNPAFLLVPLARPLSLWARQSTDNLRRLVTTFSSGEDAILELAISLSTIAIPAKWSLSKVRELWLWRMRVFNPLSDLLDKCVGQQWYDVPDFWDGGREDAATLWAEPNETILRMIIYGELFGDGWDEWIMEQEKSASPSCLVSPFASIPTRFEFIKYLLPDWHCPPHVIDGNYGILAGRDIACSRSYRDGEIATPAQQLIHPDTGHTRNIHPFKAVIHRPGVYADLRSQTEFQMVIGHLLSQSPLWRQVTAKVRVLCGGDFAEPSSLHIDNEAGWKQDLWENSLLMLGSEGMEMVAQVWSDWERGIKEQYPGVGWQKLRRYREVITGLKQEPEKVEIGLRWTYEVPHMARDMGVASWDR